MNRWFFIVMPALATALAAVAAVSRPATVHRTPAAIDASVLLSLDAEFNALGRLEREYSSSLIELELAAPPARVAARQRAATARAEWLTFSRGIQARTSAVESILTENAMDEVARNYFRLRSEFAGRRGDTLRKADSDLQSAFDFFEKKPPPPMLGRDKLDLLHTRLNLRVLTRDNFAMPDYRLLALVSHEEEMHSAVDAKEKLFAQEIQEEFRRESEKIMRSLDTQRAALEEELELAVGAALSEAGKTLDASVEEQAETSRATVDENALRRRALSAPGARESDTAAFNPAPLNFDGARAGIEAEFLRKLSRKAPAIAERNGNSIIFNTGYPEAGSAKNITGVFRETLGL